MKKTDLTDKQIVKRGEKDMRAALKMARKDDPDLVMLLDTETLTPVAAWEYPAKMTAKPVKDAPKAKGRAVQ